MTFRIAQISDTHLSETRPYFVDNFVRIGEALRASKPDLVVNTGDVSLDGASHEDDLAAGRRLHDKLGLPLRFLPGNHDLGDAQETASHGEFPIDAERRARYLRYFGPDWWSFDVPGWRILGLNAQLLGSDLAEAAEQDTAIAQAMDGLGQRSLALFLHKPLFDQTVGESAISSRFLTPAPRQHLMTALGVVPALVVSGHIHQYRSLDAQGSHHVWGPSTAFVLPERIQPLYGLKEVGYVEHHLHEDGRHDSAFVRVPDVPTLDVTTLPRIYGPA
jgi:3',5'-cyclic AMP phosphodiesterase CpdA